MARKWRYLDLVPLVFPLTAALFATYEAPVVTMRECALRQCTLLTMVALMARHWVYVFGAGVSILCSLLMFSKYFLDDPAAPPHHARLWAFFCDAWRGVLAWLRNSKTKEKQ
jgi:hypothetical protein